MRKLLAYVVRQFAYHLSEQFSTVVVERGKEINRLPAVVERLHTIAYRLEGGNVE